MTICRYGRLGRRQRSGIDTIKLQELETRTGGNSYIDQVEHGLFI